MFDVGDLSDVAATGRNAAASERSFTRRTSRAEGFRQQKGRHYPTLPRTAARPATQAERRTRAERRSEAETEQGRRRREGEK